MAGFYFEYVKICTITKYYNMNDLVARLNNSGLLIAERVGGRIKIRLAVTIPKKIYSKNIYKSHVKKVIRLYSKSAGSLKLGITISDNLDSDKIISSYLKILKDLMAENGITHDMIKI